MFLFHTLVFILWLVVINPHRIPNDNASQECLTFMVTTIQKVSADCEMLHLCSCESCYETHFVEILLKPSLTWMISWAEPRLNADDRPLNSHLSIIQKSWCRLILHLLSSITNSMQQSPSWEANQRISPGPRLCIVFRNMVIFYGEELLAPHPSWRTTPCWLSATAYSQLTSIFVIIMRHKAL
jgi:hypothetical protein